MDQRTAVRIPVQMVARCCAGDAVFDATIADLSGTGVLVRADHPARPGDKTELRLELGGQALRLAAEVVRVVEGPAGIALRFLGLSAQVRRPLANYIMQCHAAR